MHTKSNIYLVDWGSATLQQIAPYEGTVHYASVSILQQLTQGLDCVKVSPADDLESLVVSFFCIRHLDAHRQLQNVDRLQLPVTVLQWWRQIWMTRPQWQLALGAARAANYGTLADRLQTLLEYTFMVLVGHTYVPYPTYRYAHVIYCSSRLVCCSLNMQDTFVRQLWLRSDKFV